MISADIKQAVSEYAASGELIGFHCHGQLKDKFYAGFVETVEDDRFFVRYINPHGFPGHKGSGNNRAVSAWFDFGEIIWVKVKTPYLLGIKRLHNVYRDWLRANEGEWITNSSSYMRLLKQCLSARDACTVQFGHDEQELALVTAISNERLSLTLLDENGSYCGEQLLRVSSIRAIRVGGIDELTMSYLAKDN